MRERVVVVVHIHLPGYDEFDILNKNISNMIIK